MSETILGKYNSGGNEKIVVACKDFTSYGERGEKKPWTTVKVCIEYVTKNSCIKDQESSDFSVQIGVS